MAIVTGEEPAPKRPERLGYGADWRPSAGHDVDLTDLELAKLGLLAQLEAQCRMGIGVALKGAASLTTDEWMALEKKPFEQLITQLTRIAALLDTELSRLVDRVEIQHRDVLKHRHQNLHSVWAHNAETGLAQAWDLKRNEQLPVVGLDDALKKVADLTFETKACSMRVAQLIFDGTLPESTDPKGPRIFVGTRWVKL